MIQTLSLIFSRTFEGLLHHVIGLRLRCVPVSLVSIIQNLLMTIQLNPNSAVIEKHLMSQILSSLFAGLHGSSCLAMIDRVYKKWGAWLSIFRNLEITWALRSTTSPTGYNSSKGPSKDNINQISRFASHWWLEIRIRRCHRESLPEYFWTWSSVSNWLTLKFNLTRRLCWEMVNSYDTKTMHRYHSTLARHDSHLHWCRHCCKRKGDFSDSGWWQKQKKKSLRSQCQFTSYIIRYPYVSPTPIVVDW